MQILPSVCPLDCPDRCALDVTVDNGRVVTIDGSRRSEYTDGYICSKVRRFPERQNSGERVLLPMKRVGPKGSRAFEPIPWADALDLIAARFTDLTNTLGPEAILPFHYDGSNGLITSGAMDERFWNRLGASQISKTYCAANTGAAWSTVFGDLPGCDPTDLRQSDAIVLWGVNPSVTGIHMVPWVREARANGAFLSVVDPRLTPLARDADLHDYIQSLPEGYDTKIGEEGIKLSVGQKQRMAIARATLTNPRILILDDATSALDSKTEANVQASLERLMKGRTNFVIAHRLSTIMNADQIVVMDQGEIADVGTHAELVARPGVYQNLYNEQFKSAQEEALASLLG